MIFLSFILWTIKAISVPGIISQGLWLIQTFYCEIVLKPSVNFQSVLKVTVFSNVRTHSALQTNVFLPDILIEKYTCVRYTLCVRF